jgi:hypothetical protein
VIHRLEIRATSTNCSVRTFPSRPPKPHGYPSKIPACQLKSDTRGVDGYLQRVRSAAMDLIRRRLLLQEDLDDVLGRARSHWDFATRE